MKVEDDGTLVRRNSDSSEVIRTREVDYLYDGLSSLWSNDDLKQIKQLSLSSSGNYSAFVSADVKGVARIVLDSNLNTNIVLFDTSMGQMVLNGSSLLPVRDVLNGTLVGLSFSELMELTQPLGGMSYFFALLGIQVILL